MCLAVPMKIISITDDGVAQCQVGESSTHVTASAALLPEMPKEGDYIIVHAGFALRTLDPSDAQETLKLLREMASLATADDF